MSYLGRENINFVYNDFDDSDLSSSESEAEFLDDDAIQQSNLKYNLYIFNNYLYMYPILIYICYDYLIIFN